MANSVDHAGAVPPPLKGAFQSEDDYGNAEEQSTSIVDYSREEILEQERIRLRVDLRLCSIAGLLCSLNLLDSGVISNAAVTSTTPALHGDTCLSSFVRVRSPERPLGGVPDWICTREEDECTPSLKENKLISYDNFIGMLSDLELDKGNRYAVSIFIFTIASIVFQLPSTIAVRTFGPRIWFSFITFCFGVVTLCTAFITSWRQMIALRILLGMAMSGIYPGLTYLISTYYTRKEQQLRFALLQSGEVIVLATGGIVNFGLNTLDGKVLKGWQWVFDLLPP